MKIITFGDNESNIVFRLMGIDGILYEEGDPDFEEKFSKLVDDPEIGIIIITERVFINHQEFILPIKMKRRIPIIIEIPTILNEYLEDYANDIIKSYIGINLQEEGEEKNA